MFDPLYEGLVPVWSKQGCIVISDPQVHALWLGGRTDRGCDRPMQIEIKRYSVWFCNERLRLLPAFS